MLACMGKKKHNADKWTPTNGDRDALDRISVLLDEMPKWQVIRRTADAPKLATQVLHLTKKLRDSSAFEQLSKLPKELWDIECLERAALAAQTVLHIDTQLESDSATADNAKLDVTLVQEATLLRRRMLKVCSYYFEHDPTISPELLDIANSIGYPDMADDLRRLAALYRDNKDIVSKDSLYYDKHDADSAKDLADKIHEAFDAVRAPGQRKLADRLARAFTLLVLEYDQVRKGVTFVYWGNEEKLEKYPPIASMGRVRSVRLQPPNGQDSPAFADQPSA